MKITAIGDIHGSTIWKQIVEQEADSDKFVFIGDYFDNFESTNGREQLNNFLEIMCFKECNPGKVEVLIGNHDYHYLPYVKQTYSGFQPVYKLEFGFHLDEAIKKRDMVVCYSNSKFIFTHAGISKTWLRNCGLLDDNNNPNFLGWLCDEINDLFLGSPYSFRMQSGLTKDPTGNDINQGPLWIRPGSLISDGIDGYHQIVGHTQKDNIWRWDQNERPITFIDTLHAKQYLTIENDILFVRKIKT